jgi:hypothetical protein
LCPHIYSIKLFGLKFNDELGISSNVYSSYKRINSYCYCVTQFIHFPEFSFSFQLLPVGDFIHRLFGFVVGHHQPAVPVSTMRNRQMEREKPFE